MAWLSRLRRGVLGTPATGTDWAVATAGALDDMVDAQLPLLTSLTEDGRRRAAAHMAELVMLAQSCRHHAYGWIDRRELERRGRQAAYRIRYSLDRQPRDRSPHDHQPPPP